MKIPNEVLKGLAVLAMAATPFVAVAQTQAATTGPAPAQSSDNPTAQKDPERFWIAGRYDGNRVIVYFDAVKFNGTLSSSSHELPRPVAEDFFDPVRVSESYAVRFQKGPNSEHFALGDKYDLILGAELVRTVTLTTLVGAETDEAIGNDSFIGALATLNKEDTPFLTSDYYVLRRHRDLDVNDHKDKLPPSTQNSAAYLEPGPVRFDIQMQIAELLTQQMRAVATDAQRRAAGTNAPFVEVRAFHLPDGSLRYYASAGWNSGQQTTDTNSYSLAAWISPKPTLHVLAIEPRTFGYNGDEPKLLNVVDIGEGKAGMIVFISSGESVATELFEYRDGVDLKHMHLLQSLAFGE